MGASELEPLTAERLHAGAEHELADLTGLQLASADLAGKRLTRCRVVRSTLTGADLRGSVLDEVELEDCDLSGVRLAGSNLSEVVFRRCKLLGVDWSQTTRSLIGQPLVFEGCQLDFGVFRGMPLRGSIFHDCSARECDLVGTDLTEASFAGTTLERARFGETTLAGADLTGARGYAIDPRANDVRGMRVGLPEGAALLRVFGIEVDGV